MLALLLMCLSPRAEERWEPQPWPSPALGVSAEAPAPPARGGLLEVAYRWYRATSRENPDGTCPFYPTCSGYGILAVREHGPVYGVLLAVDRLFREYPRMEVFDHYPIVMPHGTPRLHDPVVMER